MVIRSLDEPPSGASALRRRQALACAFTVMLSALVFGQAAFNTTIQTTDFSGEWTEIPHEIGFTAELYDYSGLPVNAAGRMRYDTATSPSGQSPSSSAARTPASTTGSTAAATASRRRSIP
jgi:hypothetical protein